MIHPHCKRRNNFGRIITAFETISKDGIGVIFGRKYNVTDFTNIDNVINCLSIITDSKNIFNVNILSISRRKFFNYLLAIKV